MSRTEFHRGKLIAVNKEANETTEQLAERILKNHNIKIADYYDNIFDCLRDELYKQYFHHKKTDIIYIINDEEFNPDEEVIVAKRLQPNQFEYDVRFYNGGASMDECIEEAMDNLYEKEQD